MRLTWEPYNLKLKQAFHIAHGSYDERQTVFINLDGGLGEAAIVPYYGETLQNVDQFLRGISPSGWDPFYLESIINSIPAGSSVARTALDVALHDLWGKHSNLSLYRLLGLNPVQIPPTSFTISIDEPHVMAEEAKKIESPIIKVKLGSKDDVARIAAIREVSSARLHVDANGGWARDQAAKLIPRLADFDLEFIEQPLQKGDIDGLQWLHKQDFGLPIFVDENVLTSKDIPSHAGIVDGVVIKLMKCGGIREAIRAIHVARALDLQVMIGCMVESSLGVTAAAHIAPLADYVDLDAPWLLQNDPFIGIRYEGERIVVPDNPGLGVDRIQ